MSDNARGIVLMMASTLFFSTGDAIIKYVGTSMPLGQMLLLRGLFASALILLLAWLTGALVHYRRAVSPMVVGRTLAEVVCSLLFFGALLHMRFADAAAIGQFAPLALMAGAALFLGETVGWRRWSAAGVGLIGVLLVIKPGTSAFQPAALLMLASMLFVAARDLFTRRLPGDVPTEIVAAAATIGVTLLGVILYPFETWQWPSRTEVALLATCAVTVLAGFTSIIQAVRLGELAVIAPFRYSYMLFATLSGLLIFDEQPDRWSIAGVALVVGAGLYAFYRQRRLEQAAQQSQPGGSAP